MTQMNQKGEAQSAVDPAGRVTKRVGAAWVGGGVLILGMLAANGAALDWKQDAGYRHAALPVVASGKTGFTRMAPGETGITFTNALSDERSITNRNLLSGSGVAVADVDGDGLCDIYFCSLGTGNTLFKNLGGWKFQDVTQAAGVACPQQDSTGAVLADIDGDGDFDLLVNSLGGGTRIFANDGRGKFTEITDQAGVRSATGSTSMALADIDGDGDLDLYVANFRPRTIKDEPSTRFRIRMENGGPIVAAVNDRPASAPDLTNRFVVSPSGTVLEQGEPDVLYLNDGRGRFAPVPFTGGDFLDEHGQRLRDAPRDWGLAVQFHDLNGDGAPDLYICNDLHTPDRIWMNDGHGRFQAIGDLAIRCTSVFSMGVDMADVNRDGNVDVFVVDMFSREHVKRQVQVATSTPMRWPVGVFDYRPQINRNTLQIGRGDGTFAETAWFSGVEASEWSWGPIFLDVDLDGYEDIVIMNGQLRDFQNADLDRRIAEMKSGQRLSMSEVLRLVKLFPRLDSPKLIFRNRGNLTFEEMGQAWGFSGTGIAQGMAVADLDNDGDLDIITNNLNEGAGIYRNNSSQPRVAVHLHGRSPNSKGIGAQVKLLGGAVPLQSQEIICGGRYLSGEDPARVFAAGTLTNALTLEVTWRDGSRSTVENVRANHLYEIDQGGAISGAGIARQKALGNTPGSTNSRSLFEDASRLLQHTHVEEPFDDFVRQPLLPNRLSQSGPGVCWQDYDGDGWEDLIIGSGRSGPLAVYRNNTRGGFTRVNELPLGNPTPRDQTSVLVPALNTILVGSSNYEDGLTNGGALRIYDLSRKRVGEAVLGQPLNTGPVVMGDIDNDGDLDMFIGGRALPGRYPEPATSLLMRNQNGRLVVAQRFDRVGIVNGAVFSDLNGDGFPDLVLACEWGPVRVFLNSNGSFAEATEKLGLAQATGLWNGVNTGDLDGDGRLDIVASNWGLNSVYRTSLAHPRKLYFGDFDGNGTIDIVDAHFEPALQGMVPQRGFRAVASAMPFLQERISSFEAYARSTVVELYGERLAQGQTVEAATFKSMAWLNRGDHFEATDLPDEAQWSPAFGVAIGDLDGDGAEDLFLSQNFYAVNPDAQPCNAGRGLVLRGDGQGRWRPMSGQESGVKVYGEQRGAALCDYDQDGRLDLVDTQNGGETKLYHNVGAKPGLRVRLIGAGENPWGIGAALRLENDALKGPVHEIHGGAGYLSQDGLVQVLYLNGEAKRVWVRWPGGRETVSALPNGAHEVRIEGNGSLTVGR